MEDRLAWTDTVSLYALHDVDVDPRILQMWGHLRKGVTYFLRYLEGQHKQQHIDDAQQELFEYTKLVQQHFGMHELMTYQLHTTMAHAAGQAQACGPHAFSAEFWVERLMQVFKRIVKYRSTRYPEVTAVNHWLTTQAVERVCIADETASLLYDKINAGRLMSSTAAAVVASGAQQPAGGQQAAAAVAVQAAVVAPAAAAPAAAPAAGRAAGRAAGAARAGSYDSTKGPCWLSGLMENVSDDRAMVRCTLLLLCLFGRPARLWNAV